MSGLSFTSRAGATGANDSSVFPSVIDHKRKTAAAATEKWSAV
jgi:hypothetical protein